MADKPEGNPLDAWMAHIDQSQGQTAQRGRPTDKKPPQQPPKK
jgi:hypothetical protein